MKQHILLKIVIAFLVTSCSASAINLDKLVGTWTGKRNEIENGVGAYSKVTLKASIRENGGLLIVERGKWPDLCIYTWRHKLHQDGTYTAIARSGSGLIFATTKGTWKRADGKIRISGTNSNFTGTFPFKGSLKRNSRDKLVYSGKSGLSRVIISGSRR